MKTQKIRSGAARRMGGLVVAGIAAAFLAQGASAAPPAQPPTADTGAGENFNAPEIPAAPMTIAGSLPPNIMLLLNTGSITHYGYLPTNGDRYDLKSDAFGVDEPSALNRTFHSVHINKIYYDPAVEYKKPLGINPRTGLDFVDAPFAAAPVDGYGVYSSAVKNLGDDFRATHYDNVNDYVDEPKYKTDSGVTIGKTAHYNLYHPGRVAYNDDGTPRLNPSVKDAAGNETWEDVRTITTTLGVMSQSGASINSGTKTFYIVNKGGEAHLTYGEPENPGRLGCAFQYNTGSVSSIVDYSKYGRFGGSRSDYVFPDDYHGYPVKDGYTNDVSGTDETNLANAPQSHLRDVSRSLQWIANYYNCFEAIRVGEAEDKDEYYPWWKNSEKGRKGIAITAADKRQNFANWYSYYYHPAMLMKTVLSHALEDMDPDTRIGYAVTGCSSGCGSGDAWGGGFSDSTLTSVVARNTHDGVNIKNSYVKRGVRPFRDFPSDDPSGYGPGGPGASACTPAGQCKTQLRNWLFGLKGTSSAFDGYASMRKSLAGVGAYYMNDNLQGPWSSTPGFNNTNETIAPGKTRYQSCRKSYTLILTGGNFDHDDGAPLNDVTKFVDSDGKDGLPILHANETDAFGTIPYAYVAMPPFQDQTAYSPVSSTTTTLADVAMTFWKNDLLPSQVDSRPGDNNNVPRSTQDPAFWQHMNVLAIHLDADAHSVDWNKLVGVMKISDPAASAAAVTALGNTWGYPGPAYASKCSTTWINKPGCPMPPGSGWGNPDFSDREEQPGNLLNGDDLMHAALNSRGFYASTLNPKEISALIEQGLAFARKDSAIGMSTVTTNTTSSRVPMIYQALFNDSWNGKLLGYRICTAADVARDYHWDPVTQEETLQQNDSRCRESEEPWFKASWDAAKELQAQIGADDTNATATTAARQILTWNPATGGGVFLNSPPVALKNALACGSADCAAEIAYLYGNASREERKGGAWRNRVDAFKTDETVNPSLTGEPSGDPRVLGDIVNSNPLFVGRDDYGWAGLGGITYGMRQDYRLRKAVEVPNEDRPEVIYVGANDGMLHAFNAETGDAPGGYLTSKNGGGREIFAYVPYAVWGKLKALRDPDYTHEFFVDGLPTVGDAYLENSSTSTNGWNTVLIGSTGAGGSGYFALDVENPAGFSAGNVLWDIRGPEVIVDAAGTTKTKRIDDAVPYTAGFDDLGYTIGQAVITLLKYSVKDLETGTEKSVLKWVAVFPNGYNSYLDRPMLYVVDLKTGAIQTALKDNLGLVNNLMDEGNGEGSPTNPNGLSTPVAADLDNDGIADVIYAGDLRGNLWRFRLNGAGAIHTEKIFEARDAADKIQPITARPEVGRDRYGNVMVYFGTGSYITPKDIHDKSVQTFYGVRDTCASDTTGCGSVSGGVLHRGNLLKQTIKKQENRVYQTRGETYSATIRVVSDNQLGAVEDVNEFGFYLDLELSSAANLKGERSIYTPLLWSDRVIFNTVIPNTDECDPDLEGFMYELDPSDGSSLEFSAFDLDHDGTFGDKNDLSLDGERVSGLGIGGGGGLAQRGDTKYHSNTKGKVTAIRNNKNPAMGRKYWRQIR